MLVWVDFWVGLGLVSAFVGNVWDFVSPLSAAARALDRLLARHGGPGLSRTAKAAAGAESATAAPAPRT